MASEWEIEHPLTNLAIAVAVGLIGPGRYSLDAALGIALPAPQTFEIGLVLVLLGTALALLTRAPEVPPAPTSADDQLVTSRR